MKMSITYAVCIVAAQLMLYYLKQSLQFFSMCFNTFISVSLNVVNVAETFILLGN